MKNTLDYSDEEGKVLVAALTEFRQHLAIALNRIPVDSTFIPPPDRAIQLVTATVDGLLLKLQAPATITVCSRDGEEQLAIPERSKNRISE